MNPIQHIKGMQTKRRRRGSRGRGRNKARAAAQAAPAPAAVAHNNYAFIDAQNIHRGVREQGWELDWKKFRTHLRETLHVTKALLFIGRVDGNEELYKELQDAGFDLVFKETVVIRGKDGEDAIKGNVDADLVLHAMIEHAHYDKAVIATGDGDFHSLVKHLHGQGKLGKLVIPHGRKTSKLLKEFADHLEPMDALRATLEGTRKEKAPEPAAAQAPKRKQARTPDTAAMKAEPRKRSPRRRKAPDAAPAPKAAAAPVQKLHPVWY